MLGVLWEGTHMFDGVPEAMELLRSKGIQQQSLNFMA